VIGGSARVAVVCAAACVVLAWPTAPALAGGTVHFTNRSFETGKNLDVPFFDELNRRLEGSNYVAQLYAGNEVALLAPVGKPVPFSTNGYSFGGSVDVHTRFDGGSTWVQVRAWEAAGGPTFEQAATVGRWTGISDPLFLPGTGGGTGIPTVPPYLIGLRYPGQPIIVRQPGPMVVRAGERATVSVVASSGDGLTYVWFQGASGDLSHWIPEAEEASYTTPPLTTNSMFWVFVYGGRGYVESATAVVRVLPAEG
jgi:hypothetical protein